MRTTAARAMIPARSFIGGSEVQETTPKLRVEVRQSRGKMADRGGAVSVKHLVDGSPAELIDHIRLGVSRPIYVSSPTLFTRQHSSLAEANHHGHDRGVLNGALLAGSKSGLHLAHGRFAPGEDLAHDRRGERAEHIVEGGGLCPCHAGDASFPASIAAAYGSSHRRSGGNLWAVGTGLRHACSSMGPGLRCPRTIIAQVPACRDRPKSRGVENPSRSRPCPAAEPTASTGAACGSPPPA